MIVYRLPLIVVLGAGQARRGGESLGGFVGFETKEELLFAPGISGLAQAAVAEHEIVVRLEVFGINRQGIEEGVDCLGVAALEK